MSPPQKSCLHYWIPIFLFLCMLSWQLNIFSKKNTEDGGRRGGRVVEGEVASWTGTTRTTTWYDTISFHPPTNTSSTANLRMVQVTPLKHIDNCLKLSIKLETTLLILQEWSTRACWWSSPSPSQCSSASSFSSATTLSNGAHRFSLLLGGEWFFTLGTCIFQG